MTPKSLLRSAMAEEKRPSRRRKTSISKKSKIKGTKTKLQQKPVELSNKFKQFLIDNEVVLQKITTEFESKGTIIIEKKEFKSKPPFKNINFSVMEKLYADFSQTCEKLHKSKRQVIQELMLAFVEQNN
jgi:hypothetical protein